MKKMVGILIKKSNATNIKQEIVLNNNISAPIEQGQTLGTVHFYLDDQILESINLVAEKSISKLSVFSMYSYITDIYYSTHIWGTRV